MKSINFKIKVFSLLLILSSVSPALLAENFGDMHFNHNQRVVVHEVSGYISHFIDDAEQLIKSFIDSNNLETYGSYIKRFDAKLQQLRINVLDKLNTHIQANSNDALLKQVFTITHEILGEIYKRLERVKFVLQKHQNNKSAIDLVGELKPVLVELTSASTLKQLDNRLGMLEQLLKQIEFPDIAAKIAEVRLLIVKSLAAPAATNQHELLRVMRSRLHR